MLLPPLPLLLSMFIVQMLLLLAQNFITNMWFQMGFVVLATKAKISLAQINIKPFICVQFILSISNSMKHKKWNRLVLVFLPSLSIWLTVHVMCSHAQKHWQMLKKALPIVEMTKRAMYFSVKMENFLLRNNKTIPQGN